MISNKEIFLNWIKDRELPESELDHDLATANKLKFNNHAENADLKDFVTEQALNSAFRSLVRASS